MKINKFLLFLCGSVTAFIFLPIFTYPQIVGGDYISPYYNFYFGRLFPFSNWDPTFNLGMSQGPLLHYAPINFLISLSSHISLQYTDRLIWWIPFILISFFSSLYLLRTLFRYEKILFLSPLVFILNTYILLVVAGGQIAGIGIAYALSPLYIAFVYKVVCGSIIEKTNQRKNSLLLGIILSVLFIFDFRIVYILLLTSVIVSGAYVFTLRRFTEIFRVALFLYIIPFCVTALLNLFWLLPTLLYHTNPIQELGVGYSSGGAAKFFSFAKLENTLSLLHPNWPENIFGKVGFMKPEFLVIPILAFAALFFVRNEHKEKRVMLAAFALIGLIGAFLSKGAQDPFGQLYLWMFDHVPGFVMFRDPLKWYVMVALSYSVLIPFTITEISAFFEKKKKVLGVIAPIIFILFWLIITRQTVLGKLPGVFQNHEIPQEYTKLNNYLLSDKTFSRTLWVTAPSRFSNSSITHPVVSARDIFGLFNTRDILNIFDKKDIQKALSEMSIKYVIIPYDSEGEIFVKDRKYDITQYENATKKLDSISWLHKVNGFNNVNVYETTSYKDHFWLRNLDGKVDYVFISPSEYRLRFTTTQPSTLVFSEGFDANWQLYANGKTISSQKYEGLFNSFKIPAGKYQGVTLIYTPQKYVNIGIIISSVSFLVILIYLLVTTFRKK